MPRNTASEENNSGSSALVERPRCLPIIEHGIKDSDQFNNGMGLLMGDIVAGRVTSAVGNAVCNAAGKITRMMELQLRYGRAAAVEEKRVPLTITV